MLGTTTPRRLLQTLLIRDLLGPWGSAEEVLDFTPRNKYLVGMLAPVAIDSALDAFVESDEEAEGEPVSLEAEARGVGAPVEEMVESAEADTTDADDKSVSGALVHPSSMGLRCQVPLGTESLRVAARWGRYTSSGVLGDDGKRRTVWTREPVEAEQVVSLGLGHHRIEVDEGRAAIDVEVMAEPDRLVVEVALLNLQKTGRKAPPQNWLFQAELEVVAVDGSAVFLPTRDRLVTDDGETDDELRLLNLLYRDRLEYAVGRTCAVTAEEVPGERRARRIATTWLPRADVPQTKAMGEAGVMLDMAELAEAEPSALATGLNPLLDGYDAWLGVQAAAGSALPPHLTSVASDSVERARWTLARLRKGLDLLDGGPRRVTICRGARTQSSGAGRVPVHEPHHAGSAAAHPGVRAADRRPGALGRRRAGAGPCRTCRGAMAPVPDRLHPPTAPALVSPEEPTRSSDGATAELLFFPTGGGKTEAYLGLAAYTFAIRRRQGVVDTADGPLDGGDGVAVIMRYTLRLLTSQQFQRATALMCAAELERRADEATWGAEPFRIGLWVGTDVSPKRFEEAKTQVEDAQPSRVARTV